MIDFLTSQGWNKDLATFVAILLGIVACSSFALLWIIFSIWLERKIAGRIQDRLGPNRTGPFGLFQSFADLGKLLGKEDITPNGADLHVYNIAPFLAVVAVVLIYAVIPFSKDWIGADLNIGVLYFTAVGSFGTLAILLAGWGSNNKYALLGAFRVIAQLVSYEIPMILSLVVPVLLAGTMSTQGIVQSQSVIFLLVIPITAFLFFTSSLAESGRTPFDLLEAESEIIAGYNIEYSGMKFGMFMAAEFMHAFTICLLVAILFMGGWKGPGSDLPGIAGSLVGFAYLFIKANIVYFVVMLVRNTLPRIRIDQMMAFNWKFLVPLALVNVLLMAFLAKLFTPQYGAVKAAIDAGGFIGGLYSLLDTVFGANFVADLPRNLVLLAGNVGLWVAAERLLRQSAILAQRRTNKTVVGEAAMKLAKDKPAPASAGD